VATGQQFSSVSGSWTVPTARESSSSPASYSAVWVGLGGSGGGSQALEQVGVSANYVNGHAEYYAWYELVPSPEVKLNIAVHPGDKVSAVVTVSGTTVTISLTDETTHQSVVKTLHVSNPNTSSAEWIVEAPARQDLAGNAEILPLANFGTVTFTNATATAGGHTGGITDSQWSATQVQLVSNGDVANVAGGLPGFVSTGTASGSAQSSAGATASSLTGAGFSVTWQQTTEGNQSTSDSQSTQSTVTQDPQLDDPSATAGSGYGSDPSGALDAAAGT
jgi:hypothetical protein